MCVYFETPQKCSSAALVLMKSCGTERKVLGKCSRNLGFNQCTMSSRLLSSRVCTDPWRCHFTFYIQFSCCEWALKVYLHRAKSQCICEFFFDLCCCWMWTWNWILYELMWKFTSLLHFAFAPLLTNPYYTCIVLKVSSRVQLSY